MIGYMKISNGTFLIGLLFTRLLVLAGEACAQADDAVRSNPGHLQGTQATPLQAKAPLDPNQPYENLINCAGAKTWYISRFEADRGRSYSEKNLYVHFYDKEKSVLYTLDKRKMYIKQNVPNNTVVMVTVPFDEKKRQRLLSLKDKPISPAEFPHVEMKVGISAFTKKEKVLWYGDPARSPHQGLNGMTLVETTDASRDALDIEEGLGLLHADIHKTLAVVADHLADFLKASSTPGPLNKIPQPPQVTPEFLKKLQEFFCSCERAHVSESVLNLAKDAIEKNSAIWKIDAEKNVTKLKSTDLGCQKLTN